MPKFLVSILIILSFINTLNASQEKESKEWNEIKSTTKKVIDKSSTFSKHVLRDAEDGFNEFSNTKEVKKITNDFNSYYKKIKHDASNLIDKIGSSAEAKNIRKKSDEIWKSIFGEKPKK